MTTPLFRRIEILAQLDYLSSQEEGLDETLKNFCTTYNIAIPIASGVQYGYATLTEKGEEAVNTTFEKFLALVGTEDTGFDELEDFFEGDDD